MRVLAVGGGAREHAIVSALARSGAEIFACLKNMNPGIARTARELLLTEETDIARVVQFAKAKRVELAVIGPEAPLEAGLADALITARIATASPSKAAARLETSKSFMRELLSKHKVKGAVRFKIADSREEVGRALDELGTDIVVKPIGLTGGKGVKVFGEHMMDKQDIIAYTDEILSNKIGGSARVVLEEKLVGGNSRSKPSATGGRSSPCPRSRTTSGRTKATRDRTQAGWARTPSRTGSCRS
jgi:phosphoribosylamine--glycine ligase